MKRNNKLNKANSYRLLQEVLRNKALSKGVNLIAPETIFLSNDTTFGKNVTVEPYVVSVSYTHLTLPTTPYV